MTGGRPDFPLKIPAGRFRIAAALDDRLRIASGAGKRDGRVVHPGLAFVMALGGSGQAISETLEAAGYSIARSPLLAACAIELTEPLEVDTDYRVEGEVVAAVRKPSRRFGSAEHLRLRYDFRRDGGVPIASLDLTMVIGGGRDE